MINNEEREFIDRFERTYNNIDDYLKKTLGRSAPQDFVQRLEQFADRQRWWRQYDYPLKQFGKLRNALWHEYLKKDVYVAVPTLETVDTIERILTELQNPLKVTPLISGKW